MPSKLATSPIARMRGSEVWQPVVDQHAAARVDVEVRRAGELVARAHADGEDHDVGALVGAVAELEAGDLARAVRVQAGGDGLGLHRDAARLDEPPQRVAAAEGRAAPT